MKVQLKKLFPLAIMLVLLVLVVSLLPKEGAAKKTISLKQAVEHSVNHKQAM